MRALLASCMPKSGRYFIFYLSPGQTLSIVLLGRSKALETSSPISSFVTKRGQFPTLSRGFSPLGVSGLEPTSLAQCALTLRSRAEPRSSLGLPVVGPLGPARSARIEPSAVSAAACRQRDKPWGWEPRGAVMEKCSQSLGHPS